MAEPETSNEAAPAAKGATAGGLNKEGLSNAEKAAIVVMSMGAEAAATIFKGLSEEEVENLTGAITQLSVVDGAMRDKILKEFFVQLGSQGTRMSIGGWETARSILDTALGEEKSEEILKNLEEPVRSREPFGFLKAIDTRKISANLQLEQPQTIALVLSHLPPPRAAEVFCGLPPEQQVEVAERIGTMDRVSPAVVKRIEGAFKKQFVQGGRIRQRAIGGVKTVANILNNTKREISKRIFEGLEEKNEQLLEDIKRLMVVFEDLGKLPDASMQLILREVDMGILALAMKGAPDDIRALILRNLSTRAADRLKEEIELMGPKPRSEVNEAQGQVVKVARKLEEEGRIRLSSSAGGEDELVD